MIDRGEEVMTENTPDYSILDKPEILMFLFHPRPENGFGSPEAEELSIPAGDGCFIGGRYYHADIQAPTILFFHGNGEIAADYDDLAPFFTGGGINFLPVDYRGYGRSTGSPSVTAMMTDCHDIYSFVRNFMAGKNNTAPFILMGRSLGSASVLELASNYHDDIDGLIIESGFAHLLPLMQLLGINPASHGITTDPVANLEKIKLYHGPTLIIHAEFDHIIPFSDGENLFNASPDTKKKMLKIPDANHNTIFACGLDAYIKSVKTLITERC